jgi:hypothetical protein
VPAPVDTIPWFDDLMSAVGRDRRRAMIRRSIRMSRRPLRIILAFVLSLGTMATLAPVPTALAASKVVLAVPAYKQEPNWCVLASNQVILKYAYGISTSQCAQAVLVYRNLHCCDNPRPAACRSAGVPLEEIQRIDGYRGINTIMYSGALNIDWIRWRINANRPFIAVERQSGGTYHAVVVVGYDDRPTYPEVYWYDPFYAKTYSDRLYNFDDAWAYGLLYP